MIPDPNGAVRLPGFQRAIDGKAIDTHRSEFMYGKDE